MGEGERFLRPVARVADKLFVLEFILDRVGVGDLFFSVIGR